MGMGKEQRDAIRRALNEDAGKLIQEGDPATRSCADSAERSTRSTPSLRSSSGWPPRVSRLRGGGRGSAGRAATGYGGRELAGGPGWERGGWSGTEGWIGDVLLYS